MIHHEFEACNGVRIKFSIIDSGHEEDRAGSSLCLTNAPSGQFLWAVSCIASLVDTTFVTCHIALSRCLLPIVGGCKSHSIGL